VKNGEETKKSKGLTAGTAKAHPNRTQERYVSFGTHKPFDGRLSQDKFSEQNPTRGKNKRHSTRPKKKAQQLTLCCLTGVNPIRTHGFGVWGNRREVVGIRIDKKLYATAKPILIEYFGSVCRPIESFLATIVSSHQTTKLNSDFGVNPRNTIEIGKLVIERNIKTRRRLVVDEETTVKCMAAKKFCSYCGELATYEVKPSSPYVKDLFYVCDVHYDSMKNRGLVKNALKLEAKT